MYIYFDAQLVFVLCISVGNLLYIVFPPLFLKCLYENKKLFIVICFILRIQFSV